MEVLFSQPFSAVFVPTGSSSDANMSYQPNGSATLKSAKRDEQGNWRVTNNLYCSSWDNLRDGKESCFSFARVSPDLYTLSVDNKDAGQFTINSESLVEEELRSVFTGQTFIGGDIDNFGWDWTFKEDGTAVTESANNWPDQTWAIEGDLLCRTKKGERPCVTVYRYGGLYQMGLDNSDKRESWWIHAKN